MSPVKPKLHRNRAVSAALALLLALLVLGGCGLSQKEPPEGSLSVYAMNLTGTGLVPAPYVPQETEPLALASELIGKMKTMEEHDRYASLLPDNITMEPSALSDAGELSVQLSENYADLTGYNEILIRAGIVRTLTQIPEVTSVAFYVGENTLTTADGAVIGAMTADTFIDYIGTDTESMMEMTLTLYYASTDGQHLVRQSRDIYYNTTIAPERLVLEYLKEKPEYEDAQIPIPASTRVLNIAVSDKTCYVNLDASFLTAMDNVAQRVSVYAIVNSLAELPTINKVQITVEGASEDLVFGDQQLSAIYEPDLTLVEDPAADIANNVLIPVPGTDTVVPAEVPAEGTEALPADAPIDGQPQTDVPQGTEAPAENAGTEPGAQ